MFSCLLRPMCLLTLLEQAFAALISDLPAPKLGLNSCGGESALTVAKSLAYVALGRVFRV